MTHELFNSILFKLLALIITRALFLFKFTAMVTRKINIIVQPLHYHILVTRFLVFNHERVCDNEHSNLKKK